MKKNKTLISVICTFLATTILWITVYNCTVMSNPVIKKAVDAYDLIEKNYIFDYDEEYMKDVVVAAMVMSLGDRYSQFFSKDYYESLEESMDGHYYGIGIMVIVDPESGNVVVDSVTENSPAERSGILPGDIIIEVEGTKITYENYEEAISIIKGDSKVEGTEVSLKVSRGPNGIELTKRVKREKIVNHTVDYELIEPGIAYIKISSFDNETQSEFLNVLGELGPDNIKGLILDLRDNGGGTLYATQNIADMLMPKAVLTTFKYKDGSTRNIETTDRQLVKAPICILVNGNSASASEVLTSGLRDNGRAKVVGEQTFGKAIAQQSIPFETEKGKVISSIYITNASYLTPKGEYIHEKGITPDYIVKTPEEYKEKPVKEWDREKDTQLKKAVELIKEEIK